MKEKISRLIAKGETQEAIDKLLAYSEQIEDDDFHQEVIRQSSRFKEYIQSKRIGTSPDKKERILIAEIKKALMAITSQIPENINSNPKIGKEKKSSSIDVPPKGKLWKWIVGLGLLIAIPAGFAEITGYTLRDLFGASSVSSNTVTVLVHGKKGKDELILPNRGIVKLIYGDAIVPKQINADGEATFKQVSDVFFEKGAEVEIIFQDPKGEPYRAANPDIKYKLTKGKYIPLEVHLYGLGKVSGIVKDFKTGKAIKGARVSIQQEESFSNDYGEFTLLIPEEKQKKLQTIRATKEGYHDYEISNVPIQTQREIPILLKPID